MNDKSLIGNIVEVLFNSSYLHQTKTTNKLYSIQTLHFNKLQVTNTRQPDFPDINNSPYKSVLVYMEREHQYIMLFK